MTMTLTKINGSKVTMDVQQSISNSEIFALSEFLETNFKRCIPVPLVKGTKMPYGGFKYNYEEVSDEQLWKKWKDIGMTLVENGDADLGMTLREGIIVIDFDDKEQGEIVMDVDGFKSTPCVESKKGFHFYFKVTEECSDWTTMVRPYKDGIDIDVLCKTATGTGSMIVMPPSADKKWIRHIGQFDIQPLPSNYVEFHNAMLKSSKTTKKNGKKSLSPKESVELEKLTKAVMGLSDKRAEDYEDWRNICWAINNVACENDFEQDGHDLIHDFSKKCATKYNERAVDRFIRYAKYKVDGLSMGTIMKFLKRDNRAVFDEVTGVKTVQIKGYAIDDTVEDTIDIFDGVTDRPYDFVKEIFERTRFKIRHPICYCEETPEGDIVMRSDDKFKKAYVNLYCKKWVKINGNLVEAIEPFIKHWYADPHIRTYEKMEMFPPPLKCPKKVYNLWNGFAAERMTCQSSGNVTPFLDLIELCVNHDQNGKDYLIKWLAQLIQEPGKIVGTAPVIRGVQGTGKNTLWDDTMKLIIGSDKFYQTSNPTQHLFSRFSSGRFRRFLICVDETKAKDSIANSEDMKNAIVSKTYQHEIKGVDPLTCSNYNRFSFLSNRDAPIVIEDGDRRYFVFTMSGERFADKTYWDNYYNYIQDESNLVAIYEYLKGIDISGVNWISDRPITDAYRDIQSKYVGVVNQFLLNVIKVAKGNEIKKSSTQWYTVFESWCENNKKVNYPSICDIGIKFGKLGEDPTSGIVRTKNSQTCYIIDTRMLGKYFERRGLTNIDFHFSTLPFMKEYDIRED